MRTTMMHLTRRLAGTTLVALALATGACGEDDSGSTGPEPGPGPGPAPSEVAGAYALTGCRTLGNLGGGGTGLPVNFVDGSGDNLTFIGGTLTLGADGRFDLKIDVTFNGSASVLTDYGTYSAQGASIEFASEKAKPRLSTAAVSGNQITARAQVGDIPFEIDLAK
jgi:hypothetical protein